MIFGTFFLFNSKLNPILNLFIYKDFLYQTIIQIDLDFLIKK